MKIQAQITLEIKNKRWYELAEIIGDMQEAPETRLVLARQPRTVEDHKTKQKFQKLLDEQQSLNECEEKVYDGSILHIFTNHRDVPMAIVMAEGGFHTVRLAQCQPVVHIEKPEPKA